MMAKMFYTLEEAQGVLGRNEEEIKQLSREGRLREFRDGQRMMFKADQVDALKSELGSGGSGLDRVDLGPSDSGMAIGLVDSRSGDSAASGMGLTLTDSDESTRSGTGTGIGSGVGSGIPAASGTGMSLKDDTALAADLGLSGSVGGIPSPGRSGSSGSGGMSLSGSATHAGVGSRAGVDIFQNEDVDRVDAAAQTAVGGEENLSMESVGSGSGLLDLTREGDDTSLGAELLDEIAPGSSIAGPGGSIARRAAGESAAGGMGLVDSPPPSRATATQNVVYEDPMDPMSTAFGLAALGATAIILVGAFALFSGLLNNMPPLMHEVASKGFPVVAGAGLAVGLIGFVIGLVLGKSAS